MVVDGHRRGRARGRPDAPRSIGERTSGSRARWSAPYRGLDGSDFRSIASGPISMVAEGDARIGKIDDEDRSVEVENGAVVPAARAPPCRGVAHLAAHAAFATPGVERHATADWTAGHLHDELVVDRDTPGNRAAPFRRRCDTRRPKPDRRPRSRRAAQSVRCPPESAGTGVCAALEPLPAKS